MVLRGAVSDSRSPWRAAARRRPSDVPFRVHPVLAALQAGRGADVADRDNVLDELDVARAPGAFDLQMDISASANVPLLLAPTRFWSRARALAKPTHAELLEVHHALLLLSRKLHLHLALQLSLLVAAFRPDALATTGLRSHTSREHRHMSETAHSHHTP